MPSAIYCWLLLSLASASTLAQTHAIKPPIRNATPAPQAEVHQPEPWMKYNREPYPYLPEDFPQVPALAPNPFDPDDVYTYVEQLPTLLGAGDMPGIVAALKRRLLVPSTAPAGRVFVQFVVTKEGVVSQPQVLKGVRADVDSAVVAATRQLPCFAAGKHNGQPVPVRLTLLITIAEQRP